MSTVKVNGQNFVKKLDRVEIEARIAELAARISHDFAGKKPLLVGILNGAYMFAAELSKHLTIDCRITFAKVSSYSGTGSSGAVTGLIGFTEQVSGQEVILVEDIVDTGYTMQHLLKGLQNMNPAGVYVATLLLKPEALKVPDLKPQYVGFEMPNDFLVGYGLDFDGYGRNLPHIYQLESTC